MKYYFEDEDNRQRLIEELESWRGTPYRHRGAVKKSGVDCIGFVLTAYKNVGAIKIGASALPKYTPLWHYHSSEERLYKEFKHRRKRDFREVSFSEVEDGDLILYELGKVVGHCGIVFGDSVYQSLSMAGVNKIHRRDSSWDRRKRCVFKVVSKWVQ